MHRLLLCCSLGVLMLTGCTRPTFTSTYPIAADDAVEAKLAATVDVNYNATPFGDVIVDLLGQRDINVYVKWPILRRASVERETPITLQLKRVPAATVLRLVMEQVAAHDRLENVTATIRDGMVVVSTERDLDQFTITAIYEIEDLIQPVIAEGDWPVFKIGDGMSWAGGPGASVDAQDGTNDETNEEKSGDHNAEKNTEADTPDKPHHGHDDAIEIVEDRTLISREEQIEMLCNLIQDTIGKQEEWTVYGGTVSSLREFQDQLIVKTTPEQHRALRNLLELLRKSRLR